MRGHDDLIAMRRAGKVPTHGVSIRVDDEAPWDVGWIANDPRVVTVHIRPDECLDRIDLRCLVGLKVAVIGERLHERSVRAVCGFVTRANAQAVVGLICNHGDAEPSVVFGDVESFKEEA